MVLIFLSDFMQALALKGPLEGAAPADLYDCLDGLVNAIIRLNLGIVLIDDSQLPPKVAEHYAKYDAVVAFDNLFVMKIHGRSLVRSWSERIAGPEYEKHIDHELKMIEKLLKHRTHELTQADMAEAVKKLRPAL